MTTLSVPISPNIEEIVSSMIKKGYASNKAEVVRKALLRLAEEEAINDVLEAEREVREGKVFYGDLDKLAETICK